MSKAKEKEMSFQDVSYEKSLDELFKESEKVAEHVKHIVRVNSSGGFPSSYPSKRSFLEALLG